MSPYYQKYKYKLIHLTSDSTRIQTMEQNQIHFRAEFTIEVGKIEEYKKLIQEMSRTVQANEPDTINYQFYLNKDQTKCVVHETYVNSDAALAHNNGIASRKILPRIFSLAKISRFDVYGNPNEELRKSLVSFGAETFNLFTGFSR
jgi:quinol monooxygenase YgiN